MMAVMSFDVMSELVPVVNYPTHSAPSIKGGLFAAVSPRLCLIVYLPITGTGW